MEQDSPVIESGAPDNAAGENSNTGDNSEPAESLEANEGVLGGETEEGLAEPRPEDKDGMVNGDEEPKQDKTEKVEKLTKFPLARIKHLMKMDPDLNMASQESVYLVSKALEMFVESLAREAYGYTERAKKKTVAKSDVDKAIDTADCLAFLEGAMDD